MKKFTLALSAILSLSMATSAFADIGVSIDGKEVAFTTSSGKPIIDENNRTLVPLRAAMEAYGCTVYWNDAQKTAIVSKGMTTVKVPVGQSIIFVNDTPVANDTSAKIIDGRVYLPIRAVLEAFGASVGWEQSTQSVTVSTANIGKRTVSSQPNIAAEDTEFVFKSVSADFVEIDGERYIKNASFHLRQDQFGDLWISGRENNFFSVVFDLYKINRNDEFVIPQYGIENPMKVLSDGNTLTFSCNGKSLQYSNLQEGLNISNSVRICFYEAKTHDINDAKIYMNASDFDNYFDFPIKASLSSDGKTLILS